jgi:pimeloyl-ACP methyl ester carboxylesterase
VSARPAPAHATKDGVVLLHGISRTARSFRRMQTALEGASFTTLNLDYASRRKALEALAEDIHPSIQRFAEDIDGSVHFVCHSMGGLLARIYIARYRPKMRRSMRCFRRSIIPSASSPEAGRSIRSHQHSCQSRMTDGYRWRTPGSTGWRITS